MPQENISSQLLRGMNALVTGGGSGIGKAAALRLAEAGAKVAVLERNLDKVQQTVQEMGGAEKGHLSLTADVSNEAEMRAAYQTLSSKWDRLDILVPNAGINGVWAPLTELSVEEWDSTLGINLRGTFLTVKLALPLMQAKGGSIVVVSSINGTRIFSNTGATAYACSKAAQVAFVKMIAVEVARDKIRVNVVCPGWIETNIEETTTQRNREDIQIPREFPEGDIPLTGQAPGQPEQVAEAILFLASPQSSHITGTEVYVDGGQSLIQ